MRVAAPAPPLQPVAPAQDESSNAGPRGQRFERLLQDAGDSSRRTATATRSNPDGETAASDGSPPASGTETDPSTMEPDPDPAVLPIDALVPGWPPSAMGACLIAPPAAGAGGPATASPTGAALFTAAVASTTVAPPPAAATAAATAAPSGAIQSLFPGSADAMHALPPAMAADPSSVTATPASLPLPVDAAAVAPPLLADLDALLRRQEGADAEAPAPFAPASSTGNAGAALGLARTSVVNPMEAPSADLHGDGFADSVGGRLLWMAEQKIGHAHIRINPAELGPVEIRMRLDGERVHADFSSGQSEVRQALESSLPRLREMLASQGFALGQAGVGDHGQSRPSDARQDPGGQRPNSISGTEPEIGPATMKPLLPRGLFDAYA
jgi:flagellar hook-length control protein FliK